MTLTNSDIIISYPSSPVLPSSSGLLQESCDLIIVFFVMLTISSLHRRIAWWRLGQVYHGEAGQTSLLLLVKTVSQVRQGLRVRWWGVEYYCSWR